MDLYHFRKCFNEKSMSHLQDLISIIQDTHQHLAYKTSTTANKYLTLRNWLIGFYIAEYEQHGEDRAQYRDQVVDTISKELDHIMGIDRRSLYRFRQFYQLYPHISQAITTEQQSDNQLLTIVGTVSPLSDTPIAGTVSPQFRRAVTQVLKSTQNAGISFALYYDNRSFTQTNFHIL